MRLLQPTLTVLAAAAATASLAACGADVEVGDDVAVADATITADGHTYQVTDLQVRGSDATARTSDGRKLTLHRVDGAWTVTEGN